jgi:predicted Ser/Thr protein kinase
VSCPSADALTAFVAGALEETAAVIVEAHIDTCEACRAALSAAVRGATPEPRFGRYRIDTVLGAGGMGLVYRAYDPQLDRAVAIKVVRRVDADDAERARLVREARSLARLSHPHVCHVYDVGEHDGEVWVAMELVDGVDLRQWALGRAPAEIEAALVDAARGLAAAHAAGLVHRDVKPQNVLVTRAGRAVVTDFGLARADDRSTTTGAVATISGTPAYLAPEQLTAAPIDARVDQFAWAVTAWELLCGERPFPVEPAARLAAIRAGMTAPRGVRAGLGATLTRALRAAPRERFGSMEEVIAAMSAPAQVRAGGRARIGIAIGVIAIGAIGIGIAVVGTSSGSKRGTASGLGSGDGLGTGSADGLGSGPGPGTGLGRGSGIGSGTASGSDSVAGSGTASGSDSVAGSGTVSGSDSVAGSGTVSGSGTASVAGTGSGSGTGSNPARGPDATGATPTGSAIDAAPARALDAAVGVATAPPPDAAVAAALAPLDAALAPPAAARGRFDRARAERVIADCRFPVDPARPDPALGRWGAIVDWGPITRREDVLGLDADGEHPMTMFEVDGARGRYRFDGTSAPRLGALDAAVGDLVVICPFAMPAAAEVDHRTLPPGWRAPSVPVYAFAPTSTAPQIATALASIAPLHVPDSALRGLADDAHVPRDRPLLVWARPRKALGARWDMGGWTLDATDLSGADLLAPNQPIWLVVDHPMIEGTDRRPVLHGIVALRRMLD